jgi:hypothetical protein
MRIPFAVAVLFSVSLVAQDKAAKIAVDFEKQIWPILEKRCVECHATAHAGPDGKLKKPKGGWVLDTKDGISGSKKGKHLIAKKVDDSLLYTAISLPADHEDRMPPAKKGEPLTKDQIALIKQWIEEGAPFGKWVGKKTDDKTKDGGKDSGKDSGGKPAEKGDKPKEPPEPPTTKDGEAVLRAG